MVVRIGILVMDTLFDKLHLPLPFGSVCKHNSNLMVAIVLDFNGTLLINLWHRSRSASDSAGSRSRIGIRTTGPAVTLTGW